MIITGMDHFQSVCKKKLVEWYNKSDKPHKGPNDVQTIDLRNVFMYGVARHYRTTSALHLLQSVVTVSMLSIHTTEINRKL